ncbi:MAG: glycosyltransferase [Candidatus Aenigmarchaeota archaeon]|nr:glycosyltransferase [Candidatus Aenigmarchaeota archaeon]
MKPLVSICIPNYNGERYIRYAIESALNQSYRNIEVVVIDNASTDGSWNIIKSYGKRVRKFRHKFNIGYNRNLNSCVEIAKGKYMKILHSDDILEKDAVEHQTKIMKNMPTAGFVYSPVRFINEEGNFIGNSAQPENDTLIPGIKKLAELLEGNHIMFPSVMIRKECFEEAGFFDGEMPYCNDWDMWMRICMKYDAAYSSRISALYRVHTSSGSMKYEKTHIDGFDQIKCLNKIFSMINDNSILERKKYYYKRLAMEQISRGLNLVIKGNGNHGRKYIMFSPIAYNNAAFTLFSYFIYMTTYLGKIPAKYLLALGKKITRQ